MATEATERTAVTTAWLDWKRGVLAGAAGAVVFGVMLTQQMTPVIENAIPTMYGLSGGVAGWVIHISHGAVLGVVFAGLASTIDLDGIRIRPAAGATYGIVLWVALAVLVMPVWLQTVGFAGAPAVPNVSTQSLIGHVVHGIAVGVVFAATSE